MLNTIMIMGRLTAAPELMHTKSDTPVCSFNVAVDRDYAPNGEKITDFITVVAWRQTAEFISRNFGKGQMILVQGSMQSRKYQDKDGNNRVAWEVQTDRVWFAGPKAEKEKATAQKPDTADEYSPMDDDWPL